MRNYTKTKEEILKLLPITQAEISKKFNIDSKQTSRIVQQLIKDNKVVREKRLNTFMILPVEPAKKRDPKTGRFVSRKTKIPQKKKAAPKKPTKKKVAPKPEEKITIRNTWWPCLGCNETCDPTKCKTLHNEILRMI